MLQRFGLVPCKSKSVQEGNVFGRLEVKAVGRYPDGDRSVAICQCSCGSRLRRIYGSSLLAGESKSCGCARLEKVTKHGLYESPHYARWHGMMARCYNPESISYSRYGGRGIKVCDRWHDVETFVAELPPGYVKGAQLDRIDNDGDYEPGNVQWLTPFKNAGKRRDSHPLVKYRGKTQSVAEWAEETGIDQATLIGRLFRRGWSRKKALTTPPQETEKPLTYNGRTQSVSAWAEEYGILYGTLKHRLAQEWPVETALTAPKNAEVHRRKGTRTYEFDGGQYSISEMARKTGIKEVTLRYRIVKSGWSVEQATKDRTDQCNE